MSSAIHFYLETSAALRAVLQPGVAPALEEHLRSAHGLVTSRLSRVESARALLRLKQEERASEQDLADASRELERLWNRCELWELTPAVCQEAALVAPRTLLRTLDALHLATFVLARRRLPGLELLTEDARLRRAARGA